MFYILLIVIVDLWNINKVSYHIINVNFLIDTTFKPQIYLIIYFFWIVFSCAACNYEYKAKE